MDVPKQEYYDQKLQIDGSVERFCLIWGIYAKFGKKMIDSSQLIRLVILVH